MKTHLQYIAMIMTYRRSIYYLLAYSASAFTPPPITQRMVSSSSLAAALSIDTNIMDQLPSPLILGSGSFTRKLILNEMGIDFTVIKRPIDERGIGDRETDAPHDLVLTLAKAKCDHLVHELEAGRCSEELEGTGRTTGPFLVLTGDQVVTLSGKILEKPESIEEAKSFCAGYAKAAPSTVGSCVIHHVPSGIQVSGVDSSTIYFQSTIADKVDGKDLVDRLLETDAPILDCAGGLMIEHPLVQEHLERIDGTEDSVMGLSKNLVNRLLQEMKSKLKDANQL